MKARLELARRFDIEGNPNQILIQTSGKAYKDGIPREASYLLNCAVDAELSEIFIELRGSIDALEAAFAESEKDFV